MTDKLAQLHALLLSCGRTLVAYSGGADSALLAKVAGDALGANALAVIADSPSLPRRELAEALALAERFGFAVRVIQTAEMDNPDYASNPPNRCYFCKRELFQHLTALARAEAWQTIIYGENADDLGDFRPGAEAAQQFAVRAPLKELGLTKAVTRELSSALGLPTADKPAMACLSSRIPYGQPVTATALARIEQAENALRDLGFREVRVRHHDNLARIEVGVGELDRLLGADLRQQVIAHLHKVGYLYVTLDLGGYRRGSTNEVLASPKPTNQ